MTGINQWRVTIIGRAQKQREKLPAKIGVAFELLVA